MTRRITQIATATWPDRDRDRHHPAVVALCNDGTLWAITAQEGALWERLPPIPQDAVERDLSPRGLDWQAARLRKGIDY